LIRLQRLPRAVAVVEAVAAFPVVMRTLPNAFAVSSRTPPAAASLLSLPGTHEKRGWSEWC